MSQQILFGRTTVTSSCQLIENNAQNRFKSTIALLQNLGSMDVTQ